MAIVKQKVSLLVINWVKKYCNDICFLCYLVGVAYFVILAHRSQNDGNYFSENALLPGLVQGDFYDEESIHDFRGALVEVTKSTDRSIPAEWLVKTMRNIGLEAYVHDYNVTYPLGMAGGESIPGRNVFGILRAFRTPSTESLVLSAPYRPPNNGLFPDNHYAIATMLSFAQFARRKSFWAKDIIFLVTDHEAVGMEAWLEAYHHNPSPYIQTTELQARGGSIQAAINLEMNSPNLASIDVKIQGLNGQLPNLDLFNLVVRMCRKEAIVPTYQNREDHRSPTSTNGFLYSFKTMIRGMLGQASGFHSGNHGLFHKYHVEAVTLSSLDGAPANARYGAIEMARILEATFRSLNNLLERFHQSFFFYVLPATERYISIGLYVRPLFLIGGPLLVQALAQWIAAGLMEPIPQLRAMFAVLTDDSNETSSGKKEASSSQPPKPSPPVNVFHLIVNLGYCYVMAFIVYVSPKFFLDTGRAFRIPPSSALLLGHLSLFIPLLIIPVLLTKFLESPTIQKQQVTSVACVVQGHSHDAAHPRGFTTSTAAIIKYTYLILITLFMWSVALLNYSITILASILVVPVALLVRPCVRPAARFANAALVLAVSPPALYLMAVTLHVKVFDLEMSSVIDICLKGLLAAVVDIHGIQTMAIVVLGYLPLWTLMWTLVVSKPKDFDLEISSELEKKES